MEALARTVYSARRQSVLRAAAARDTWGFAAAMYDTGYYQGFGATREVRIGHYADTFRRVVAAIEQAITAAPATVRPTPSRLLCRGVHGADVTAWQERLNRDGAHLKLDGDFGLLTETATRHWQELHQLRPDGIVGPKTRAAAGL